MTFQGRQWLMRIEWRLAASYGIAISESDWPWARAIESAWTIVRRLHERSASPGLSRYRGGMIQ